MCMHFNSSLWSKVHTFYESTETEHFDMKMIEKLFIQDKMQFKYCEWTLGMKKVLEFPLKNQRE